MGRRHSILGSAFYKRSGPSQVARFTGRLGFFGRPFQGMIHAHRQVIRFIRSVRAILSENDFDFSLGEHTDELSHGVRLMKIRTLLLLSSLSLSLVACGGGQGPPSLTAIPGLKLSGKWFSPEFGDMDLVHAGQNVQGKYAD